MCAAQPLEHNLLIKPVEELRPEVLLHLLQHQGTKPSLVGMQRLLIVVSSFPHKGAQPPGACCDRPAPNIAGEDHQGILEVHMSALGGGEPAVLHDLKQDVEHVRVRLFDFVKKHDAGGPPPHRLCQLATILITLKAWRRANHPAHTVPLHVLAHVQAHQSVLRPVVLLSQRLHQLCLADACGPHQQERSHRAVGAFEPTACTHESSRQAVHGLILAYETLLQGRRQLQQSVLVVLTQALHSHSSPRAHHILNVCRAHKRQAHAFVRRPRQLCPVVNLPPSQNVSLLKQVLRDHLVLHIHHL
mmetsp:Transcript_8240/g.21972  ORF Transcript_8240/g.21972 Transcript_8240/m.21972 type:complete len:302 (-) Transcript_8240:1488-2393(-)